MDSENKFWITIWTFAAIVAITIVSLGIVYNNRMDQRVQEMSEKGIDPVKARCAIDPGVGYCRKGVL